MARIYLLKNADLPPPRPPRCSVENCFFE